MDISITKDIQNKLLKRREIAFSLGYTDKTPQKDAVKEEICKKLGLNPASTVIIKIEQLYGGKRSACVAHSYESEEAMKIEAKYLFERHGKKEHAAKETGEAKEPEKEESKEGDEKTE